MERPTRPGTDPPMPRSVFCAYGSAYQERAVADDATVGRFTHMGVTLALGTDPDWAATDLHPDEEWQIEWTKCYFGLNLAHAFAATGDRRYVETFVRLVGGLLARVPVDRDTSDVSARRISNWVYAWSRFAEAPGFSGFGGDFESVLLDGIRAQARWIRDHLTPERNHRTLELYSLFVVSLALPQIDAGDEQLAFTIAELDRDMQTSLYDDGVHYECSTHYHMIVLRSYVALRENARRFGLELPAGFDDRLARACEFALHCHRPDGAIPAFSDSDTGSYHDLLDLAADLLDRDDFRFGASGGRRGTPPAATNISFASGGYFFQRSGWGTGATAFDQERFLLFDCGPIGRGGHGHYDALSVEIAGGGRPLLMDPGRYTYSEHGEQNLRHWFKGTPAHNTITVDGLDQTPYRRGKPKQPATARLLGRWTARDLDLLDGEVRSAAYGAVHRRLVLFVASQYWVIVDDVSDTEPHAYDLRWHLAPQHRNAVETVDGDSNWSALADGVSLTGSGPGRLTLEDGWISPQYGTLEPAPVVSRRVDHATSARFVTVIRPDADPDQLPGGRPAISIDVHEGADLAIRIDGRLDHDALTWSIDSEFPAITWSRSRAGAVIRTNNIPA